MTKIIGITGGIGTGKSTVSSYLRQKGYRVLDADEMARGISQKERKRFFQMPKRKRYWSQL